MERVRPKDDPCIVCFKIVSSEKEKRYVTTENYTQLGLTEDEFITTRGKIICSACRMSRILPKYKNKCPTLNCTTPRRKIKLRELHLSDKEELIIEEKFQVSKNENVCRACSYKIYKYIATSLKVENNDYIPKAISQMDSVICTYNRYPASSNINVQQLDASTPPLSNNISERYPASSNINVQQLDASTPPLSNNISERYPVSSNINVQQLDASTPPLSNSSSERYPASTNINVQHLDASTPPLSNNISERYTASTNINVQQLDASTPPLSNNISERYTASSNINVQHLDASTPPLSNNISERYPASSNKLNHGGRPRKKFSEGSVSTRRRIKSKAKSLLSELVGKYDEISKGEGRELFEDVCDKVPISSTTDKKLLEVVHGIAKAYTKEPPGPAGKTRILSTVANAFSNKELQAKFNCTDYEITQARRQATEYGPGVTPPKKNKFVTKYRIPLEDLEFVLNFIHHPDNAVPSSHRMASCDGKNSSWISDLVGGGKLPVLWLKDGKHHLYDKYKEECCRRGSRPISRTKFLEGLNAGNFKEMVEMAGLCNICDEVGARNFESLDALLSSLDEEIKLHKPKPSLIAETPEVDCGRGIVSQVVTMVDLSNHEDDKQQIDPLPYDSPILMVEVEPGLSDLPLTQALRKRLKGFRGHLLSEFQQSLSSTSNTPCHCMTWLLEAEPKCKDHEEICNKCFERYLLFEDIQECVYHSNLPKERKVHYKELLDGIELKSRMYIAHLVRGKYQKQEFLKAIRELRSGQTIAVCDYMMKLLLQKFREPQKDWYAKKGVSVHGCMFFFRSEDSSEIEIEIHDLFSNGDCTQNWFFTASAFEASFTNFQARHPNIHTVSIWSDNGPHYHNTSLMLWLMRLPEFCPLTVDKYSFFEAQKGKTALDAHFATFKFVLRAWMKRGNDIQLSEDITNGTKDHLKGTHVYEININRNLEPPSAKTWAGITGHNEFIYHYENNICKKIEVKEQTNATESKTLKKSKLLKLWPSYICSESTSTGVTSAFDMEESTF
jgi:hypothetical protein